MELTNINIRKFPAKVYHAAKVEAVKSNTHLRDWIVKAVIDRLEREQSAK